LPEHRPFSMKMPCYMHAGFVDFHPHHMAVPADLSEESEAQGHAKV
jgi:hypothetical protein